MKMFHIVNVLSLILYAGYLISQAFFEYSQGVRILVSGVYLVFALVRVYQYFQLRKKTNQKNAESTGSGSPS